MNMGWMDGVNHFPLTSVMSLDFMTSSDANAALINLIVSTRSLVCNPDRPARPFVVIKLRSSSVTSWMASRNTKIKSPTTQHTHMSDTREEGV
jgi:hypothetical protein